MPEAEIALRASIGAGRFRLVRQLLTESMVLAVLGGIVGLLLATWAAQLLVAFLSTGGQPLVLDVTPDVRLLAFTGAITMATSIVFGLVPALRGTRLDLSASLREHSAGQGPDTRGGRLRRLLVAGQVGLSLLLLIGASLFLRSLGNIRSIDRGSTPISCCSSRSIGSGRVIGESASTPSTDRRSIGSRPSPACDPQVCSVRALERRRRDTALQHPGLHRPD